MRDALSLFAQVRSWSLREKFKAVLSGSILVTLAFVSVGIWRFAQFNNKTLIQDLAGQHQKELARNFSTTQLIGEIQADLVSFIQTASPAGQDRGP